MDHNKYTVPNLPATHHVLEDLAEILQTEPPTKVTSDDEFIQNASKCHQHFKQLEKDFSNINELNSKLEELNNKLRENMKVHTGYYG